ncbi:MAG: PTS sugar transporter subunit IIC [Deltaproteobacteria bacterium]|nr:PTS sugar transporter subunit IIC [Deltaproteobacteria bacterium]
MYLNVTIASLMGALLCLDRVCVQAMVSRPIVAAPIMGLIFNDPLTGLATGAFLELLWIDRLPVGTYVPPNESVVAVVITSATILAGQSMGHTSRELLALSILLFLPLGSVSRRLDKRIIESNDSLSWSAIEEAKIGNIAGVSRRHLQAILKYFFTYLILIFPILTFGIMILTTVYPMLPEAARNALTLTYFFAPFVGIAVAMNTINFKGMVPVFFAVYFAAVVVLGLFHVC